MHPSIHQESKLQEASYLLILMRNALVQGETVGDTPEHLRGAAIACFKQWVPMSRLCIFSET